VLITREREGAVDLAGRLDDDSLEEELAKNHGDWQAMNTLFGRRDVLYRCRQNLEARKPGEMNGSG
jgi:hypothetical protein